MKTTVSRVLLRSKFGFLRKPQKHENQTHEKKMYIIQIKIQNIDTINMAQDDNKSSNDEMNQNKSLSGIIILGVPCISLSKGRKTTVGAS